MPNIDTRGDTIITILKTILKTIMKTILTRILKTILTTTLTKSLQDMSQIRSRYVTDMLKICLIYAKICPRYAQYMQMICPRYAQEMPKAWPRLDHRARIQFWGVLNVSLCASGAQLGFKPTWNH